MIAKDIEFISGAFAVISYLLQFFCLSRVVDAVLMFVFSGIL